MQKEMLVEYSKSKDLNNVQFVSPVSKSVVFKYISASDFGMSVLKKVDTFKTVYSNKTFDYMACRKPIFMLIDGVSRQLVEESKSGVYIEPENPQSFHDAIVEIIKLKEADLQEMGNNGYEYAKRIFDRTVLAKKYIKLIGEEVTNK